MLLKNNENELNKNVIYIGFFKRLIAFYIDIFIVGILFFVFLLIIVLIIHFSVTEFKGLNHVFGKLGVSILVQSLGFFSMGLYYCFFHTKYGATIGKKIFNIKVVDLNYRRINLKISIIRFFALLLSLITFGLGCILVFFNKKKQSLHDLISKTYVVYNNKMFFYN